MRTAHCRWLLPATLLGALAGVLSGPGGALGQVLIGSLRLEAQWSTTGMPSGTLDHPMGIAVTASGRVLVADGTAQIVVYTADGTPLDRWPLPGGTRPVGLAERHDGSIVVTDYTGDRLLVLSDAGELLATWGETGTGPGQFQAPSGVAVTPGGNLVVVEFMGQRLQELDANGNFVRFIDGGDNARQFTAERAPRAGMERMNMPMAKRTGDPHGLFAFPTDVAVAPDGTIYVSNTHHYEILVFEPDGSLREAWGSKGPGAGQWEVPAGLATDASGNLFVADSANFRVQGLDPSGRVFLVSRADERWYQSARRIYSPLDVALDSTGRLYVADFAASRIQRFSRRPKSP